MHINPNKVNSYSYNTQLGQNYQAGINPVEALSWDQSFFNLRQIQFLLLNHFYW